MDYRSVAYRIKAFFDERGGQYAVIGGFALLAHGIERATFDLDFVTERELQAELIQFLEDEGYETLHRSMGYSNHLHPSNDLGRIDFVYVDEETARKLFAEARQKTILDSVEVLVPKPEHLAAMKIRALKNDPSRQQQEILDIARLAELPGTNKSEIRGYFEALDLAELYDQHLRGGPEK